MAERANGRAAVGQIRTAVRTARVELAGDYVGWYAVMRTNPTIRVFEDLRSGDDERMRSALGMVTLEWNFVDDDGQPLPLPKDGLDWDALPYDLIAELVKPYGTAVLERSSVPKETSIVSVPTSPSDT